MKLRIRLCLFLAIFAAASVTSAENATAPIISRADFKPRDAKFAKVVEKEIGHASFRRKLSRAVSMPFESAQVPVARVAYKPDDERGGTLTLWFEDRKNKLTHDELLRLWSKIEVYIVRRFQGNSVGDSEVWAFGESVTAK